MTKEDIIQAFRMLLEEYTPEDLRALLTEAIGGEVAQPAADPILAPYREFLAKEAAVIQKLKGTIGSKEPNRYQKKMLDAYDAIVAYFDRLVEVGGDVSKAGEIPRQQWTADTGFLSGWLGADARGRILVYVDGGQPFNAAPVSAFIHDARAILDGCTDPTGEYWAKYNVLKLKDGTEKGFPCWNRREMTDSYNPTADDDDLGRIRTFDLTKGSLRSDPKTWPEPFKTAWFEGHPGYTFPGVSKIDPGVKV